MILTNCPSAFHMNNYLIYLLYMFYLEDSYVTLSFNIHQIIILEYDLSFYWNMLEHFYLLVLIYLNFFKCLPILSFSELRLQLAFRIFIKMSIFHSSVELFAI